MKELKKYLIINSIFSLFTGTVMVYFSNELLAFFNVNNNEYLFEGIGLNLIVFAFFVWYVLTKKLQNVMLIKLISFLDVLWVLGSLIIVFFQLFELSLNGYILIAIVAIWIGFLAYKQMKQIMH
jgi:hypothetical protein